MDIGEKKIGKRQIAYISFKGPYDEIPALLGELVGFIMAKSLQIMGPPFAIYYNSPQEVPVEEIMYEVGMPFDGDAEEEGRVKIKTVPAQLFLSTTHKGPYSDCGMAIGAIAQYAYQNGYELIGPPIETYISDPNETPENELVTEVSFPVMKK